MEQRRVSRHRPCTLLSFNISTMYCVYLRKLYTLRNKNMFPLLIEYVQGCRKGCVFALGFENRIVRRYVIRWWRWAQNQQPGTYSFESFQIFEKAINAFNVKTSNESLVLEESHVYQFKIFERSSSRDGWQKGPLSRFSRFRKSFIPGQSSQRWN